MHNNFAANGKHTPAEVASDGAVLRKTGPMLAELRKGFNHDALGCKDFTIFPKKGRGGTDNPVCRLFAPGKWIGANKRTDAEKSAILKKLARRANGRAANDEAKLPGFRGDYLVFKAALAGKSKDKAARLTTEKRVVQPTGVSPPSFEDEAGGLQRFGEGEGDDDDACASVGGTLPAVTSILQVTGTDLMLNKGWTTREELVAKGSDQTHLKLTNGHFGLRDTFTPIVISKKSAQAMDAEASPEAGRCGELEDASKKTACLETFLTSRLPWQEDVTNDSPPMQPYNFARYGSGDNMGYVHV